MLSDDDYFEKYWEQNKIGNSRGCIASIVRMSTYGDEPIFHKQLIPGKWNYDCHDKRVPVVMRGSLWYMQNRGCSKSANTEELVERFFRFKKYSCNSPEKHRKMLDRLRERLWENGWYLSHHFSNYRMPKDNYGLWFFGEWIDRDDDRYLEILEKINPNKARAIVNEIEREAKYEESRKKWLKTQEENEEYRKNKAKENADKKVLNSKLSRERKAKQIAALELLQEMKNAKRRA